MPRRAGPKPTPPPSSPPPSSPPPSSSPSPTPRINVTTQGTPATYVLAQIFQRFGLPQSLADWAFQRILDGLSVDQVFFEAQQRVEWKQRFIGNEARLKQGLPPLDPGTYLATEADYKRLMRTYGLPEGMYDNPDDFATLIGYDVTGQELQLRLEAGVKKVQQAPPEVKAALKEYYGVDDGGILGFVLDPKKGMQFLERQVRAAEIGGAARMHGLTESRAQAERLAGFGIDFEKAIEGFGRIGQETLTQRSQSLAAGPAMSREELEEGAFFGTADIADRIRRRIALSRSGVDRGGGAVEGRFGASGLGGEARY